MKPPTADATTSPQSAFADHPCRSRSFMAASILSSPSGEQAAARSDWPLARFPIFRFPIFRFHGIPTQTQVKP
jgi:hypothetical protein